jgi:hypothetical protein
MFFGILHSRQNKWKDSVEINDRGDLVESEETSSKLRADWIKTGYREVFEYENSRHSNWRRNAHRNESRPSYNIENGFYV